MSWQPISLSQLGVLTVIAVGALARGASAQQGVGVFTEHGDVGKVTRPGSATYDSTTGVYQLAGLRGEHLGGARRVPLRMAKDEGRLHPHRARAADRQGSGPAPQVRVDDPQLPRFGGRARECGGARRRARVAPVPEGARWPDRAGAVDDQGADVIQLERRGATYIMSVAKYGDTLTSVQATDIPLGDDVYVGLYITAHNDTVTERATLSDVRITVPVRTGFVPYREYIGSNVEVMEVATGRRRIVYHADGSIQAPNWTKDGKALIWNQDGKLYRFDLKTAQPAPINTGIRIRNNNDHVLSFDGKWLAISDQSDSASRNQSVVYVVPTEGGTPRRITEKYPSYLHGWSPDGKTLVFTGSAARRPTSIVSPWRAVPSTR
jgi:hypothetical protein